ncbi:MAG: hypothetical protein K8R59_02585 [Thermoanaerobaculales bacterium]|nr:hypothetical protein [Thermoanaerobaculales bacterium]
MTGSRERRHHFDTGVERTPYSRVSQAAIDLVLLLCPSHIVGTEQQRTDLESEAGPHHRCGGTLGLDADNQTRTVFVDLRSRMMGCRGGKGPCAIVA